MIIDTESCSGIFDNLYDGLYIVDRDRIIRNVTSQQLNHLGNRLRVLVGSSYIRLGNDILHVTISIGATLVRDNDSMQMLLKRADTLLYESKSAGRNRMTIG